ncbi:MAG TPA: fumarylacetoacetate hydrolase family protein [Anaeromyxobacteraceae bacterium]|nr:fumarylacetoacetate hydrolase family protein [Anaeromyxobacteraceae bacterium]
MARWLRFERGGAPVLGALEGGLVHVHEGDLLGSPRPTGETVPLEGLRLLEPVRPGKLIGLVTNFKEGAAKAGQALPAEPLWFIKASTAYLAPGAPICLPGGDVGKVVYEGELGVVIGRTARNVPEDEVDRHVLGYTCVNDVTAFDVLFRDPAFAQWSRAKSFDTFGPFGPVIATGLDPDRLVVRTLVKGKVRQEYPIADAVFSPRRLVALLSRELTLEAGDLIACGTSVGVGVLRPGATVEVAIDGIGTLSNPVVGAEGEA